MTIKARSLRLLICAEVIAQTKKHKGSWFMLISTVVTSLLAICWALAASYDPPWLLRVTYHVSCLQNYSGCRLVGSTLLLIHQSLPPKGGNSSKYQCMGPRVLFVGHQLQ